VFSLRWRRAFDRDNAAWLGRCRRQRSRAFDVAIHSPARKLLLRGQGHTSPKGERPTHNVRRYLRVDFLSIKALPAAPKLQRVCVYLCVFGPKSETTLQFNASFSCPRRSMSAGQPARTASDQWPAAMQDRSPSSGRGSSKRPPPHRAALLVGARTSSGFSIPKPPQLSLCWRTVISGLARRTERPHAQSGRADRFCQWSVSPRILAVPGGVPEIG
jgi:hypothetical protein